MTPEQKSKARKRTRRRCAHVLVLRQGGLCYFCRSHVVHAASLAGDHTVVDDVVFFVVNGHEVAAFLATVEHLNGCEDEYNVVAACKRCNLARGEGRPTPPKRTLDHRGEVVQA